MTTKFNSLLLEIFQRMKDPIISATANGVTYTNVLATYHLNRAIRDFLIEKINNYQRHFPDVFPEYVKTGGSLTLSGGVVAKPTDCFSILNLYASGVDFTKVEQYRVAQIQNGTEPITIASATKPVFWEEGSNIKTLGLTSGSVVPRYIVTHQDITPTLGSGGGNFSTGSGAFLTATRAIMIAMNTSFATTDVNKTIMIRSSSAVYQGIIESFVSTSSVIIRGEAIPTGNITVADAMVSDASPDSSDLLLNPYWYGEIIERAITYVIEDTKNTKLE
jgi:hypothetical protein